MFGFGHDMGGNYLLPKATAELTQKPAESTKPTESVLCFHRDVLDTYSGGLKGLRKMPDAKDLVDRILYPSNLFYMPREKVENDPTYKQVIPYVVLLRGREIFRYLRNKNGGEKRLHDLWSLGVGGHIKSGEDYRDGFCRELEEEIGIKVTVDPLDTIKGVIYDPSNSVGLVHVGILHFIQLTPKPPPLKTENTIKEWYWQHPIELKKNVHQFETWSQLVIKEVLGTNSY